VYQRATEEDVGDYDLLKNSLLKRFRLEMLKSNFFWIIDYRNEKTDFYSIIVFLIALYRRTAIVI